MLRKRLFLPMVFAVIQFSLSIALTQSSLAQQWEIRRLRGTLRVVDVHQPEISMNIMYNDFLISKDKDNKFVPSLAEDWRWIDDRTIEFKLRRGVLFHNGEEFNAKAVEVNWEAYRKMEHATILPILDIPDETIFEIIGKYRVRFTLPEPDGLAYLRFWCFDIMAPAFFSAHSFQEFHWSQLEEPGPWGAGPFKLVEGNTVYTKPSGRVVLDAFEDYWDPRYPKIKRVIFENSLRIDRQKALELCMETEGPIDIVSRIRPLDTLKVAKSSFSKVVKNRAGASVYGIFNQRKRDTKWKDIRLRKAVNYAINREELVKYAAMGNAYNLGGWIAEGSYGHNPNLALFTYDTTKARSLLAEAGYPNGFAMKIIAPEGLRIECQIISKMLERVGFKVSYDIMTMQELWRKTFINFLDKPIEEQDWDCYLDTDADWAGQAGISFLIEGFLDIGGIRWIEYDPVYETMWEDMISTVDSRIKEEKIKEMVTYLYDNACALFIYSPVTLYAVNNEVNFVPFNDGFLNLKETSVTENHWSVRGKYN